MGITDLRAIQATMQVFNSASMPSDSFKGAPALRGTKSEVF